MSGIEFIAATRAEIEQLITHWEGKPDVVWGVDEHTFVRIDRLKCQLELLDAIEQGIEAARKDLKTLGVDDAASLDQIAEAAFWSALDYRALRERLKPPSPGIDDARSFLEKTIEAYERIGPGRLTDTQMVEWEALKEAHAILAAVPPPPPEPPITHIPDRHTEIGLGYGVLKKDNLQNKPAFLRAFYSRLIEHFSIPAEATPERKKWHRAIRAIAENATGETVTRTDVINAAKAVRS